MENKTINSEIIDHEFVFSHDGGYYIANKCNRCDLLVETYKEKSITYFRPANPTGQRRVLTKDPGCQIIKE